MNNQIKTFLFSLVILFCLALLSCSPRTRDNEGKAVQAIVKIRESQTAYALKHQGKFAHSFDELIKFGNFDAKFSGNKPVVNGYVFEMQANESLNTTPAFYSITADPQISDGFNATGTYHFYFDSTLGIVKHTEENRPAMAGDPSL